MNLILKQILICGIVFFIIFWFQYRDDKKYKRNRKTFYGRYKFPLLVSSIIGLILNLPILFDICEKPLEMQTDITIIKPYEKCNMAKTFIHNNNFSSNKEQLSWFGKQASDQQIFTDLPDF
jgi:hypothetical protein